MRTEEAAPLLRGVPVGLVSQTVGLALQFGASVLIARLLEPAGFGIYSIAMALVAIIGGAASLQLDTQVGRTRDPGFVQSALTVALTSGLVAAGLTLAVSAVASFLDLSWAAAVAAGALLAAAYPVSVLVMGTAAVQGRPGLAASRLWLVPLSKIGLVGFLFLVGTVTAAATVAIEAFVWLSVAAGVWAAVGRPRPDFARFRTHSSAIIRAGAVLVLATLAGMVLSKLDILMLSWLGHPAHVVGRYHAAVRLSEVPLSLFWASLILLVPAIASVPDGPALGRLYAQVTGLITLLLVPLLAGFAVFGDVVVRILFGTPFVLPPVVYALMAVGILGHVASGPTGGVLAARDARRRIMALAAIPIVLDIVLNAAFIPGFGPAGAAAATSVTYVTTNAFACYWVARHTTIEPFRLRSIGKQLAWASVAALTFLAARWLFGATIAAVVIGSVAVLAQMAIIGWRLRSLWHDGQEGRSLAALRKVSRRSLTHLHGRREWD